jgi:2-isopropylmalate synthase
LQIDFSRHVQRATDASGAEATAEQLWELFAATYLTPGEPLVVMHEWQASSAGEGVDELKVDLTVRGERATHQATGAGPVDALTRILAGVGLPVDVLGLTQQSLTPGGAAQAITYVEHRGPDRVAWAAGTGTSVLEASLAAVIAAAHHRAAAG